MEQLDAAIHLAPSELGRWERRWWIAYWLLSPIVATFLALVLLLLSDLSRDLSLAEVLLAMAIGLSYTLSMMAYGAGRAADHASSRVQAIFSVLPRPAQWWGILLLWFGSGVALQIAAELGR